MSAATAIRAGGAYVEFFIDDQVTKRINQLAAKTKLAAAKIANVSGSIAAAGIAAGAALAYPIRAASRLEETMNKFNVVFGDQAAAMKQWGDQTARQMGRSKQQIADFLASAQDLLVPMGIDPDAARDFSKTLTTLAVDLASFNNKADADVMRDLQAAITGSGEVMKKYGVIVNETAVKQELLQMGMDPKKATDAAKAQARLNIILRGTTAAQGDAIRSAGSFANRTKALRAALADAAADLGGKLLPLVTPLVDRLATAATVIGQFVEKNAGLIVSAVKAGAMITALAGGVWLAATTVGALSTAVAAAATFLSGTLAAAAGVATGALAALLSPFGLIAAGLAGIGAAWLTMSTSGQAAIGKLTAWFADLKQYAIESWQGIADALKSGDLAAAAKIAWLSLKVVWLEQTQGLRDVWQAFTDNLVDAFARTIDWIRVNWAKLSGWLGEQIARIIAYFTGGDAGAAADDVRRQTAAKISKIRSDAAQQAKQRQDAAQREFDASREHLKQLKRQRSEAIAAAAEARAQADKLKEQKQAAAAAAKQVAASNAPQTAGALAAALSGSPAALARGTVEAARAAYSNAQRDQLTAVAKATDATAKNTESIDRKLSEQPVKLGKV